MYAYIKGTLTMAQESWVAVEAGGVGYRVYVPARFFGSHAMGDTVQLFTYFAVREDGMVLYGFSDLQEKALFERLLSVSGVGPKVAMAVLSTLDARTLGAAILAGDADAFSRVPGVGKKTAQRILLELKGKIELAADNLPTEAPGSAASEAEEALVTLGYSAADARAAVRAVKELGDTAEELTLLALKRLSL